MKTRYLLLALVLLVPTQLGLTKTPGSTMGCSNLPRDGTCFHDFASTDDVDVKRSASATGADSEIYSVKKCRRMSYSIDGDDTADVLFMECRDKAGTDCTVFTDDMDNDGDIDAADEAITFDGTAGRRGLREVSVSKPFHFIDVQTAPASGSAYVTLKCHPDLED